MCFQVFQAPSAQSVFKTASDKHIYNNQGALAKLSHMKCLKQYCLLTKVPNKSGKPRKHYFDESV